MVAQIVCNVCIVAYANGLTGIDEPIRLMLVLQRKVVSNPPDLAFLRERSPLPSSNIERFLRGT